MSPERAADSDDGSAVVQVSLFSDNPEPSQQEVAALEGLAAELPYADGR